MYSRAHGAGFADLSFLLLRYLEVFGAARPAKALASHNSNIASQPAPDGSLGALWARHAEKARTCLPGRPRPDLEKSPKRSPRAGKQ